MTAYTQTHRAIARVPHPHIAAIVKAGGDDWLPALRLRIDAFHHAGHLWAAFMLDEPILPFALDGRDLPPLTVAPSGPPSRQPGAMSTPDVHARLAVAGLLAAAALPVADLYASADGTVDTRIFDGHAALACVTTVADCGRSIDRAGQSLVSDTYSGHDWLTPLIEDWAQIRRLASALIDGDELDVASVAAVMSETVHDWRLPENRGWNWDWDDEIQDAEAADWEALVASLTGPSGLPEQPRTATPLNADLPVPADDF